MTEKFPHYNMIIQSTRNDIVQSRLWSSFSSAHFVALSDMEHYTERQKTYLVLDRVVSPQHDRDTWLKRISTTAKRLYCILLYIARIDSLQQFLATGFSDSDLPLEDGPLPASLKNIIDWDRGFWDRFLEAQWIFLAPCFGIGDSTLKLHSQMPLPFVYEASEARAATNSVIHQIQIHEAHQDFYKPKGRPRPMLALKLFQPSKEHLFKKELESLLVLRRRDSKHIIKLMASFSSCRSHGFIFAWADMNLRELFAQEIRPIEKCMIETWILTQMTGLVHSLSVIHRFSDPPDGTLVYGRHGDLHPTNILLFKSGDESSFDAMSHLQISSMGRVDFFHSHLDFNVPKDAGMYEAPECQLERAAGPLYDIWSLGCIFLEILIWLSEGPSGLQEFALARLNPDPIYGEAALDDYFFTLQAKEKRYVGAEIRPSTRRWVERCKSHFEASSVFKEVICIIEEHMLQPCPVRRLASDIIYSKMQSLHGDTETVSLQYRAKTS